MNDSLRDRLIAAVVAARPVARRFVADDGYLSVAIRSDEDAAAIAVDVVLAELNLKPQSEVYKYGPIMPDGFQQALLRHRYVTEWTTDE
jgi:hypothetical protein